MTYTKHSFFRRALLLISLLVVPPTVPAFVTQTNTPLRFRTRSVDTQLETKNDEIKEQNGDVSVTKASKRQMLGFAVPALGIFLCNPLLSNIDNAFVGRTVGAQGLAALSPATVCTDQMLFLFSFLGRATTGLVSKAYAYDEETKKGDLAAARQAASPALSVALFLGIGLTAFYALFTPTMLHSLRVEPALHKQAATYIYWRGAIAWAALSQNVLLNVFLASREAILPLKIVLLAAIVNVFGDTICCVWPFQMGCGGAAAATSFATLLSSACMLTSLRDKQLLPELKIPTRKELWLLLQYTGPLLVITFLRLLGQVNMQRAAGRLGVGNLAAFQIGINLLFLFQLFGEPLSQLSQTRLPPLVSDPHPNKTNRQQLMRSTIKSILVLAALTAIPIGATAGITMGWGSGIFTSDPAVRLLTRQAAPILFLTVATGIFSISMDGALVASQDFLYMLSLALFSNFLQWRILCSAWCDSVGKIFLSFAFRLATYALAGGIRVALGFGPLGRALGGVDAIGTTGVVRALKPAKKLEGA